MDLFREGDSPDLRRGFDIFNERERLNSMGNLDGARIRDNH